MGFLATDIMKRHILLLLSLSLLLFLLSASKASAQKGSISVNAADAAALGTISVEGSVATGRHTSVNVAAGINPWTFNKGRSDQFQDRKQTYSVGMRWWPWNVYSGWWMGARGQYQEYNRGGLFRPQTEEGDAAGLAISGGYSLMIAPHVNLDFGLGFWGGHTWYKTYACPTCGRVVDEGTKWFALPSDMILSLVYVF